MTTAEVTESAIRKGLIQPIGKTPAKTMSAALYTYIRDVGESAVSREFRPARTKAGWNSVRWVYRRRP